MPVVPTRATLAVGVLAVGVLAAAGCAFDASGLPVDPSASSDSATDGRTDLNGPADQSPGDGPRPDQPRPSDATPDHPLPPDTGGDAKVGDCGPDVGPCVDPALKYSGGQFADSPSNTFDLTDNFTISAWIKPGALKPGEEYQVISRHTGTLAAGYVLLIKQQVPELRVYHGLLASPTSCPCRDPAFKLTQIDAWYHLAGSFSKGTARLFVDGKPITSCSCPKTVMSNLVTGLRIGSCASVSCLGLYSFVGLIDDVEVAKVARTAGFDPRLPASALPCSQVVARWRFTEGSGQSAASECGGPAATLGSSPATADFNDPVWVVGTCLASR